ncbi:MAG: DUF2892 domain-containing protein [bacterium]|nr:DUF2892 domain-containing protein [bacterium]
MKKNMGVVDRTVRTLLALGVGYFLVTGRLSGVLGIALGVIAVVFLVTSAIGFCPLYTALGVCTCKCDKDTGGQAMGS